MSILESYLAAPRMAEDVGPGFDEFAAPDGTVRPGWASLTPGLTELTDAALVQAQREAARLLADDGVTYTPSPGRRVVDPETDLPTRLTEPRPWGLDPLPLVIDDREWAGLEAGLGQRAALLDAILADLYGPQELLAAGLLPPAAVFDHEEYLRRLVGVPAPAASRLVLVGSDLGRDADGHWKVTADRTQAPSGAGFAMENRRVVSRVFPELHAAAHLHRLTPFFHALRSALLDAAPASVENPRVVVLSPGPHSETAFDQATVASLLGFPLVEGSDLMVRDGRVWLRGLGKREEVDVILRRVDSSWTDPLELRPRSRLGVTGLVECVRQGTVRVVNTLGSGILENPALLPRLPQLCERLLGESLRLPSVATWWCGDPDGRDYVLAHLDELALRPISRGSGRSVVGSALTRAERETLMAQIRSAPHRFVGQEVLPLSSAPTSEHDRLVRRTLLLRAFAVRSGESYLPMLGGLARITDRAARFASNGRRPVTKDVWVLARAPVAEVRAVPFNRREGAAPSTPVMASSGMVPRVLSDLFWFGRYAERAEDLVRLVLAVRTVALENHPGDPADTALQVLRHAVTHVSTTYPGFLADGTATWPELHSLLLDRHRPGTAAQSLAGLSLAAQGVRDQLSEDVWMVLADMERALAGLAAHPDDQGRPLTGAGERVLRGLLALTGIMTENMVRDPGWFLMDTGRGLERALQVVALLRATTTCARGILPDRLVTDAVLAATESAVTFRRRYRRTAVEPMLALLILDRGNPRSVAHQVGRMLGNLQAIPSTGPTARPLRLLDALAERLAAADPSALAGEEVETGRRLSLAAFLGDLQEQLRGLSEAIADFYQRPLPPQQLLTPPLASAGGGRA